MTSPVTRYQLTQRGGLVHRRVEELLGAADEVREVSTEMPGGMLAGLRRPASYDGERLATTDPEQVAGEVATVFAQFERLVTSTRQFYASLAAVLNRYDLSREDFQAFKAALLDHLQPSRRSPGRCRRSPSCWRSSTRRRCSLEPARRAAGGAARA